MQIIVDTREQEPLKFEGYEGLTLCKDKLDAGDYTLVGHDMPNDDDSVIIERKASCRELLGNLGAGWDRFKNELEILSKYRHKCIVVCGHNNFDYLYTRDMTKLSPNFVYKRLGDIYLTYGISVFFANSREEAESYIARMFKQIYLKHYE